MPGAASETVVEMLARVPLLGACSPAELHQIAELGSRSQVADGTEVVRQGEEGREFFMLLAGQARCHVDGALMSTFGPGDFFGEMALLKQRPRQATVVADGDLELLVLDGRDFDELVSSTPSVAMKLLQAMAARQEANATLYS